MTKDSIPSLAMRRDQECPACSSVNEGKGTSAVISPWVTELAQISEVLIPAYKICKDCQSGWFTIAYTDKILEALYHSYRGDEYFRVRNSWEPSYTRELNAGLNSGEAWLNGRRAQIEKSLVDAGYQPETMLSVLDFGGGHGGVMPKLPNRYLLEANEFVQPEEGITLIKSLEEGKSLKLNLVMCCGVLEHLNSPRQLIETILELNSEVFLFEVPTGTPRPRVGFAKSATVLRKIASSKIVWRRLQRLERKTSSKWRSYFPLRCSEHLQFFTSEGLYKLLTSCGLDVLALTETSPNKSLKDARNLGFEIGLIAVCRKKS
jgi:hypothetical protein